MPPLTSEETEERSRLLDLIHVSMDLGTQDAARTPEGVFDLMRDIESDDKSASLYIQGRLTLSLRVWGKNEESQYRIIIADRGTRVSELWVDPSNESSVDVFSGGLRDMVGARCRNILEFGTEIVTLREEFDAR